LPQKVAKYGVFLMVAATNFILLRGGRVGCLDMGHEPSLMLTVFKTKYEISSSLFVFKFYENLV
jgi:hypothetical protein